MNLARFAALTVALSGLCAAAPLSAETTVPPDAALARLLEGNRRLVAGTASHPRRSAERRPTLAEGQKPFAIVLTCADSRVAPELSFDQGLGDLFVLRNAGNVLDDHLIGSIEYAVEHLHAARIIVVGHAPGHIHALVESIRTAVELAQKQTGDKVDHTVRVHARRVAEILGRVEPILGAAVTAGHVKVVAGRYDLATGRVEILS